jgi:hypothetical protein
MKIESLPRSKKPLHVMDKEQTIIWVFEFEDVKPTILFPLAADPDVKSRVANLLPPDLKPPAGPNLLIGKM